MPCCSQSLCPAAQKAAELPPLFSPFASNLSPFFHYVRHGLNLVSLPSKNVQTPERTDESTLIPFPPAPAPAFPKSPLLQPSLVRMAAALPLSLLILFTLPPAPSVAPAATTPSAHAWQTTSSRGQTWAQFNRYQWTHLEWSVSLLLEANWDQCINFRHLSWYDRHDYDSLCHLNLKVTMGETYVG